MSKPALFGLSFLILAIFVWLFRTPTDALETSWVDHPDIRFTQIKQLSDVSEKPAVKAGNNRDCVWQKVQLKPAVIRLVGSDTMPVLADDCIAHTSAGIVGGSYFQKTGTYVAGNVLFPGKKSLMAGDGFITLLSDATAPSGVYLSVLLNPNIDIIAKPQSDKTVKYELSPNPTLREFKHQNGNPIIAIPETVSFSSSGKFILFDSPGHGLVRANTETGETLSFGTRTNYSGGINPGYNLAITADGKYAVASRVGSFIVYKLDECQDQTGVNSHLKNCKSRSLNDLRVSQTGFGLSAHLVRFESEDAFTYYSDELVSGLVITRQYRVTLGDVPRFGFQYLGLGDSFASGEGSFNYKYNTTETCHIGLRSYPYLIGSGTSQESYESIACSGAKINDIFSEEDIYEGQEEDGLTQSQRFNLGHYDQIIPSFQPGKITQYTYLEHLKPEAITISIGGNDLAFADKIKSCVLNINSVTCFDTLEERKEIAEEIYSLSDNLTALYQKLKDDNRRVYVVGYPKIINPGGNCAVNVALDREETYFADRLTVLINDAIEHASKQAGVFYVDVENIFDGSRLCETASDFTLIHGITENHTQSGVQIAKESFHPKQDAHVNYKDAILNQTDNLNKVMPSKQTVAKMPRLVSSDEFFSDIEASGRTVYRPVYENFADDIEFQNSTISININFEDSGLAPLSQIKAEIHSEPVQLGTYTTDINGNLTAELTIPSSIDPGYHSIHLLGTDQAGQPLDVYDYLLVGVNSEDFDGDGVTNTDEKCVYIQIESPDSDQDGIGDACDGVMNPVEISEDTQNENPPNNEDDDLPAGEGNDIQNPANPQDLPPGTEIVVEEAEENTPIVLPEDPPVIIELPVISDFGPEKDTDTNGETVAGNEQVSSPEPETPEQNISTQNQPQVQPVTSTFIAQSTGVSDNSQPQPEQPEVLSEATTSDTEGQKVTVPVSDANAEKQPEVVKDTKVYIYYLIAGIIAFIGLVVFMLIAIKKQRQV